MTNAHLVDPPTAVAHYERLRGYVLGEQHSAVVPQGLAMLVRDGMRAWIEASCASGPPNVAGHAGVVTSGVDGVRAEIARVMVAMVLGTAEREMRA